MVITMYRREADGRLRYYSVFRYQLSLFPEWNFTSSFGYEGEKWRERVHRYASRADMDRSLRSLIRRRQREGYAILYTFGDNGQGLPGFGATPEKARVAASREADAKSAAEASAGIRASS